MDCADKFINNPSPKRLAAAFLIILAVSAVLCFFIAEKCSDTIITTQIEAMLGTAGYTEGADFSFTDTPSEEAIAAGEHIFTPFGVSRSLSPRLMECRTELRNILFTLLFGLSVLVSSVWLIYSMKRLFSIYSRLEQLSDCCEKISEPSDCNIPVYPDTFSCTSRLADGLRLISNRMNYISDSMQNEKKYLHEFLTDFSHQIKTSLAVIRLSSDMLSELDNLPEKRKKQLCSDISDNLDCTEELTFSALRLAKLSAGAVEYCYAKESLSETCRSALEKITPLLREKNISCSFTAQEDIIFSHDKIWLREAFENIIKNSAEHSGCSHIGMELSFNPTSVTVSISDNGKGIPQEEIPLIFERFGKKSNSSSMRNAGIGMPIAKKIAAAHNGDIMIYSSPDTGTRTEIVFLR